ncbi:MAG: BREX-6 system BrxE protein, partial [Polyangiaceae bacterium]|nr:BREX-6 system BrxE protein [Polyangiaceae bacterium]
FLGFEVDEQVSDRLAALKRSGRSPADALPLPLPLVGPLSPAKLAEAFAGLGGEAPFTVVPGGRQLKGAAPAAPDAAVKRLAAALVSASPLPTEYPLPFFKVEG